MLTIDESVAGEEGQRSGVYPDHPVPVEHAGRDVIASQLAVLRIVGPEWEEFVIAEIAHAPLRVTLYAESCFPRLRQASRGGGKWTPPRTLGRRPDSA